VRRVTTISTAETLDVFLLDVEEVFVQLVEKVIPLLVMADTTLNRHAV
jgi:hypothetical protein